MSPCILHGELIWLCIKLYDDASFRYKRFIYVAHMPAFHSIKHSWRIYKGSLYHEDRGRQIKLQGCCGFFWERVWWLQLEEMKVIHSTEVIWGRTAGDQDTTPLCCPSLSWHKSFVNEWSYIVTLLYHTSERKGTAEFHAPGLNSYLNIRHSGRFSLEEL